MGCLDSQNRPMSEKSIAVLSTAFHPASHTDVIVSRWIEPFPTDSQYGWNGSGWRIGSFYVAQRSIVTDLTSAVSLRHGIPVFNSIREALCLGGDELAVDAVFLIAEHGDYPDNAHRQKLYPRKEFFDQMVEVFEASGRVVPVFFDKHLSWNPASVEEMVAKVRALGIPFFAGSSVPFSMPKSLTDRPAHEAYQEVCAVYYNALESYLFHSLEFVQTLIENRPGGGEDHAPKEVVAWEDAEVWDAVDRGEFSWDLIEDACASSSDEARAAIRAHREQRGTPAAAFRFTYADGLRVTHFMQHDVVRKWCLAARTAAGEVASGTVLSSGAEHYFPHFARLCVQIDQLLETGQSPVPLERIRQTSLKTAYGMRALFKPGEPTCPSPNDESTPST